MRSPGYAAVAVATLALGIGANAAIFSLVEAALLRGLPFREPSRLVAVWEKNPRGTNPRNNTSPANFSRWHERARSFESSAAYGAFATTIADKDDAVRAPMALVTPGFFDTLGVGAALGRPLGAADSAPGAPPVAVLADSFWRDRYGADRGIVGRTITVDGQPTVVVGVMPPQLDLPAGSALFVPLTIDEKFRDRNGRWMSVVARLKDGVSIEQARAEMDLIALGIEKER